SNLAVRLRRTQVSGHGSTPSIGEPPPWIGRHWVRRPVTKWTIFLLPLSWKVTLWPASVLPTYLTGLAAMAPAGTARAQMAATAASVALSLFMGRSMNGCARKHIGDFPYTG